MRHLDNRHPTTWQRLCHLSVAGLRWYLAALTGDVDWGAEPDAPLNRIVAPGTPERSWAAVLLRHRRPLRWCLASGLMLALVLGLLLRGPALWERALAIAGPDFAASPFFTLKGFHALRPGMTPNEVRDLVGFPLNRVERHSCPKWFYTQPAHSASTQFKLCIAVFDPQSGRLAKAKEVAITCSPGPVSLLSYPWTETLLSDVGELELLRMDGTKRVLTPDGNVYFLEFHRPSRVPPEAKSASLAISGESTPANIRLYSVGDGMLGESEVQFVGTFAEIRPTLPQNVGLGACVYKNGTAYTLPPWKDLFAAEMRADRDWLVRRLTGCALALPWGD